MALTEHIPKADQAPEQGMSDEDRLDWEREMKRRQEERERLALPQNLLDAVMQLHSESDDPRFIMCVLPMISKDDVLHYLPRIVEMSSQDAVRKSFSNLLQAADAPLSAAELLVELHTMDPGELNVEPKAQQLKQVIRATSICFEASFRPFYTKEVLAVVIQQLVDFVPLPKLFMRTVIQALVSFKELLSFIMSILATLVKKNVWEDSDQWKGFIRCCEQGAEASMSAAMPVLLQLPQRELKKLLSSSTKLYHIVSSHIHAQNPANVPPSLLHAMRAIDSRRK